MTRIVHALDEISHAYTALFCDLWGCLHDGTHAYREAVAALVAFREGGGSVILLTNSPRPSDHVAEQVRQLGAPRACYDGIVSSGDAAQTAMGSGMFGRKIYHIGPDRDLPFFRNAEGRPIDVERVPLEEAEGIVCTGLVDDRTETPEDYRATLLYGKTHGLKMLCANPDVVVDVGETRVYCAGALAAAYEEAGGQAFYFGKPHSPIYDLARNRLTALRGESVPDEAILCLGDGIRTDVSGAIGEGLDVVYVTGGLAAAVTGTAPGGAPDAGKLRAHLEEERLSPGFAMGFLR